jgi:EmrB/QacA subfamily drug resistance transporter
MSFTGSEVRAIAAVAVGMFCVQVDFFALSLALPSMASDLNETTTDMQWVLSAYMIAVGAALIPAGRLGDLRGHRRVVVAGLVIFGGSSLVCGLASSYPLLIAFRSLQGLGAATLLTVSVAAISNAVADERRAAAIGALFGAANVGTALGPFVGGLLTEQLSWRWVFLLNVPLAAVAIVCCLMWLPKTSPTGASVRIDWLGLVLVSGGVVAVAYAADRGGDWGWTSPLFLGCLLLAAVLIAAFILTEQRVPDPLVDLNLFHNRPFVQITVGGTVANIVYAIVVLSTTIYLQEARGLSPILAGVVFLAPSIAVAISGPLAGRLASWQPVPVLIPATLIFGGLTLLAVSAVDAWGLYVPLLGLTGFALGLGWALPNIGVQGVVEPSQAGEAAGVSLTAIVALGGVAVAVGGTLLELGGGSQAGVDVAAKELMRGTAVLSLVAGAILLIAARRTLRAATAPPPAVGGSAIA